MPIIGIWGDEKGARRGGIQGEESAQSIRSQIFQEHANPFACMASVMDGAYARAAPTTQRAVTLTVPYELTDEAARRTTLPTACRATVRRALALVAIVISAQYSGLAIDRVSDLPAYRAGPAAPAADCPPRHGTKRAGGDGGRHHV